MSAKTAHATHTDLAAIRPEQRGSVFAVLRRAREAVTKDGKPFLDLELSDTTATLAAKVWSDAANDLLARIRALQTGSAVKVKFRAESWRDALQLTIDDMKAAPADQYDPAVLFWPACPAAAGLAARRLVVDIETAAAGNIRDLPQTVVNAVTRVANAEGHELDKVMALSPLLARVISLAVGDADGDGGTVLFAPPQPADFADPPDWIRVVTEAELLASFWDLAAQAEVVVTFNGRGFDLPFLQVRSAIHGIPARADLLSNPHALRPHLDLLRVLTGGDRGRGPFTLDTVCWAFGIESPKEQMDGSMVGEAYAARRFEEIARYNLADVAATRALLGHVETTILRFRRDWAR